MDRRQPFPDAIRALAMLAVLVVNAAGYLTAPWGAPLGQPTPEGSTLATGLQGVLAALLQGKGYPILAFAFGMGLWFSMRRHDPVVAYRRAVARQRRLLGLGVLHGLVVYFGDILTLYALVGWNLLRQVREPWPSFEARLRRAIWWVLAATSLPLMLALTLTNGWGWDVGQGTGEPTLTDADGWSAFWQINAGGYLWLQVSGVLVAWPVVRLCMLCGIAAARLRLLTHRRWRPRIRQWAGRLWLPVLLLNLGYGGLLVLLPADGMAAFGLAGFGTLAGIPMAAVYLMALALVRRDRDPRWCRWLAPLGSRTLTLYIGHGVLCMALFSGAGLAIRPNSVEMLAFALTLWCLALVGARASGERRWPLEMWLRSR